jgi:hypothetical protein
VDPWPKKELRLKLGRTSAELLDYYGNPIDTPLQNLQLYKQHTVYMSINLNAGTCSVTIQQPDMPEAVLSGPLQPATVNLLRQSGRMLIRLYFPDYNISASTASYSMDELRMRGRE